MKCLVNIDIDTDGEAGKNVMLVASIPALKEKYEEAMDDISSPVDSLLLDISKDIADETKKLKLKTKKRICSICGKELPKGEYGNNPEPVKSYSSGVCCDDCNYKVVLPTRTKERNKR